MAEYLLVKDGVVKNRVIATPDWADAADQSGEWDYVVDVATVTGNPGPGWTTPDGVNYTPPEIPVVGSIRVIPFFDFMRRFTRTERIALRGVIKTNGTIEDFIMMLQLAGKVDLDNQDVITRLAQAESAGIIATGRAAEIRA